MNALAPISDRVGKLLRLLASDNDGEVVAAVKALRRTLQSAGADLHALADVIEKPTAAPLSEAEMQRILDAGIEIGIAKGIAQARELGVFKPVGTDPTPHEMARYCQENIARLAPKHHQFVDDMAAKTLKPWPLTPKQTEYLKSLWHQAGGGR